MNINVTDEYTSCFAGVFQLMPALLGLIANKKQIKTRTTVQTQIYIN